MNHVVNARFAGLEQAIFMRLVIDLIEKKGMLMNSTLKYFEEELKEGSNPNKKSKLVTREKSEGVFYYS